MSYVYIFNYNKSKFFFFFSIFMKSGDNLAVKQQGCAILLTHLFTPFLFFPSNKF